MKMVAFAFLEVKRRLVSFSITFVILVFLSAAFVSALERYFTFLKTDPSLENFHDSLYFMVVSFTTVGYGNNYLVFVALVISSFYVLNRSPL